MNSTMERRGEFPDTYGRAVLYATDRHAGQERKGLGIPYMVHPLRVCERLRSETTPPVTDAEALLAAVLHDTVEDTSATLEEIAGSFGSLVAHVVAELTNDPSLPRPARKAQMIERLAGASLRARVVKLADRLDNVSDPPPDWTAERWAEYHAESRRLLAAVAPPNVFWPAHPVGDRGADQDALRASLRDLAARLAARLDAAGGGSVARDAAPPDSHAPPASGGADRLL